MPRVKYEPTNEELARLLKDFSYHPPLPGQQGRYIGIRAAGRVMGRELLENCPPSAERTLAMRKLEEMVFWANASIARNETAQAEGQPLHTTVDGGS